MYYWHWASNPLGLILQVGLANAIKRVNRMVINCVEKILIIYIKANLIHVHTILLSRLMFLHCLRKGIPPKTNANRLWHMIQELDNRNKGL